VAKCKTLAIEIAIGHQLPNALPGRTFKQGVRHLAIIANSKNAQWSATG
jgi:hypothetical protein